MASRIDLREIREKKDERAGRNAPVRAVVRSVQPETESVKIESFGSPGAGTVAIRHPFMGTNSWIRTMPETGTSVITQRIREPAQVEIWSYTSHRLGQMVKDAKKDNARIFRELRQGEIEIMSAGRAYQHWSEEGNITMYGGAVEQHLTQTEMEAVTRAPTHKRQLDQHEPAKLNHEERFGLVKRPDVAKPNSLQVWVKDGDAFQYEYGRWIQDDEGKDITSLHEGHLYGVDQQLIKNTQTNKPVRLRRTVEHFKKGTMTFDVDNELNMVLTNTSKAKTTDLDFGLKNDIKISSQKLDLNIIKSSNHTFGTSFTVRSPKVQINSSNVGFGAAPVQSAVLGTALVSSVLTPVLALTQAGLTALAADPALQPATKTALQGIVTSLAAVTGSLSAVLSSEVRLTK